jgi:hypothetical protein
LEVGLCKEGEESGAGAVEDDFVQFDDSAGAELVCAEGCEVPSGFEAA